MYRAKDFIFNAFLWSIIIGCLDNNNDAARFWCEASAFVIILLIPLVRGGRPDADIVRSHSDAVQCSLSDTGHSGWPNGPTRTPSRVHDPKIEFHARISMDCHRYAAACVYVLRLVRVSVCACTYANADAHALMHM